MPFAAGVKLLFFGCSSFSPRHYSFTKAFVLGPAYHTHTVRDGQTSSHWPRLVVSRSTCPPLSTPPPRARANSFVIGTAVINTHTHTEHSANESRR